MDWIKKLKVSQKLSLLILIATVVTFCVGTLGFYYTNKANNNMKVMYESKLLAVSAASDLLVNTNKILIDNLNLLQNINQQEESKRLADIKSLKEENSQRYKDYAALLLRR